MTDGTRASNGESTIHHDESGRWHGYVSMGQKEGGQRDRRHVSGASRAAVVRKVRALEAKRDAGFQKGSNLSGPNSSALIGVTSSQILEIGFENINCPF